MVRVASGEDPVRSPDPGGLTLGRAVTDDPGMDEELVLVDQIQPIQLGCELAATEEHAGRGCVLELLHARAQVAGDEDSIAPHSSMRWVKKACVSSSAIPSRWSTQPSRVTFMLKVRSPMATSLLRVGRAAGLSLVDEYLAPASDSSVGGGPRTVRPLHAPLDGAHLDELHACMFG